MCKIETIAPSEGCNNAIHLEVAGWCGFYFKLVFSSSSSQLQQSPDYRWNTPSFLLQRGVEMVCRCGHTCVYGVGSCAGGTRWCSSYCASQPSAATYTCQAFSLVLFIYRLSSRVRLHCPGRIMPFSQQDCLPFGDSPHMMNVETELLLSWLAK